MEFSTKALHADDEAHTTPDISPPIHVSTTFRYPSDWNTKAAIQRGFLPPEAVEPSDPEHVSKNHIYSRMSMDTRDRLEAVLGALENAHAVTYASGLAAVYAALIYYQPKRLIISKEGYHGTHGSVDLYKRGRDWVEIVHLEDFDGPYLSGDMIWLESPQNPRGEIYDIQAYKDKCPAGAIVAVDSTFSPPPLQYCLANGADVVMHSSTKFLGGHSDLLGGVLVVKDENAAKALRTDRTYLGSVMGNMESWLLLRSLRSLEVRVERQSQTATQLAAWLSSGASEKEPTLAVVNKVYHASLDQPDLLKKLNARPSGVLAIEFASVGYAISVCSKLKLIANATSLGGVESLIEWRAAVDNKIDPRICRLSVGLENVEDLKEDFRQAFALAIKEVAK
ncbi:hypothetical protein HDV05_008499 [Chytridiales sp. JEL 0842]|nr:hypothetical protein HDV05_008499 [Chytridiales sp. JEL 0842]